MPQLTLGQLAKSIAGRDKGRFLIVIDIVDDNYVHVADGDLRKVEKPKKKKIKHLQLLNKKADSIAEKLAKKRKVSNEEIRKALNELIDDGQNGQSDQI